MAPARACAPRYERDSLYARDDEARWAIAEERQEHAETLLSELGLPRNFT